MENYIRNMS